MPASLLSQIHKATIIASKSLTLRSYSPVFLVETGCKNIPNQTDHQRHWYMHQFKDVGGVTGWRDEENTITARKEVETPLEIRISSEMDRCLCLGRRQRPLTRADVKIRARRAQAVTSLHQTKDELEAKTKCA